MAQETYTTHQTVGIKEDVDDVIHQVSYEDTPFISSIGKKGCHNKKVEWQEDRLRTAKKNANIEGSDAEFSKLTPTAMRDNHCQNFRETAKISDELEATDRYGRSKEMAYQVIKKGKEMMIDVEAATIGAIEGVRQIKKAGNDDAAGEMGGVHSMIHADTTVDAAGEDLTEAHVLAALEKAYKQGAKPNVMMIPTTQAITVASWATSDNRRRDFGNNEKITNSVKVYASPFNMDLKVVINEQMDEKSILLYNPKHWVKRVLKKIRNIPLAKTGSAEKRLIDTTLTLQHKNYRASALIDNLKVAE